MRKLSIVFFLVFAAGAVTLQSCKEKASDPDPIPDPTPEEILSAKPWYMVDKLRDNFSLVDNGQYEDCFLDDTYHYTVDGDHWGELAGEMCSNTISHYNGYYIIYAEGDSMQVASNTFYAINKLTDTDLWLEADINGFNWVWKYSR